MYRNHQEEITAAVEANHLRNTVFECLDRLPWSQRNLSKRQDPALVADDLATYDSELSSYWEDCSPLVPFVREWQVAK